MYKDTAVDHFGSDVALARALNISRQAVSKWGEIIPEGVAYKLQVLTAGRLVVDPGLYQKARTP